MIPVTVDDLAANGLLEEADAQVCWERAVETLTATEGRHHRPRRRLRRANRGLRALRGVRAESGRSFASHVHRRRWSPAEAIALSTQRARHHRVAVPEGPPCRRSHKSSWRRSGSARLARIDSTQRERGPAETLCSHRSARSAPRLALNVRSTRLPRRPPPRTGSRSTRLLITGPVASHEVGRAPQSMKPGLKLERGRMVVTSLPSGRILKSPNRP